MCACVSIIWKSKCLYWFQVPRTLDLVLTRSGGTIGVLSVEYSVLYLPLGVTEPAQGMPVAAQGSERLEGGQDRAEFSITISNELFVEPMANFYAFLNATSLIGGGTYADNTLLHHS